MLLSRIWIGFYAQRLNITFCPFASRCPWDHSVELGQGLNGCLMNRVREREDRAGTAGLNALVCVGRWVGRSLAQ